MQTSPLTVQPLWETVVGVPPSDRAENRSDRELADALRERDEHALARIQTELGPAVLGYLTALLGDRATAEDVLQVTLLEVWERGASYDPDRASLTTWVMMIARSRAIDQMRRRIPEPSDPGSTAKRVDRDTAIADDPAEALLEQWRLAHLLTRLPRDQARMLRMRFYHDLPQREIAAQMNVPLGTVKMRMVQALERLRQMLDEQGTIS
jgi:RNA polymerase sigma-70 factor (ECF subfamily)